MKKVLFILGTRPEGIKLCPVIRYMRTSAGYLEACVCATAQHRNMLDQALAAFDVQPDYDLDLMEPEQSLSQITSRLLSSLDPILSAVSFDMVVVQGDTSTTMAGALAAFYRQIPVAHIEAGLRTGDLQRPFPEEMNRQVTSRIAALHLAPTEAASRNLAAEGIPKNRIVVTGNSGIDAVLYVATALGQGTLLARGLPRLDPEKKLIVVTAHRRESFGDGILRICDSLRALARRGDVQLVYPVHRNPNVLDPVSKALEGVPGILLIEPLDYVSFVDLMRRSWIIITDSGGIQEEAPSLGKPVLVLRDCTERPEAVRAGTVKLVGTDPGRIVTEATRLLDAPAEYLRMSQIYNPYGDGHSSSRITSAIQQYLL